MTAKPTQHNTKVIVDGRAYVVEIEDLNEVPLHVAVNGVRHEVVVEGIEASSPGSLPRTPAPYQAPTHLSAPAAPVEDVRSPMPGTILDIAVASGDRVCLGQTLCYLEAMKMKNAIRAPRDGVVTAVLVEDSQLVTHGEVLLTLE